MANPKVTKPVNNKSTVPSGTEDSLVSIETNNFTENAVGVYQDKVKHRWHLVEVKFDPLTGNARVVADSEMEDGRLELNERVKVKSVELGLVT